jgi:hypothetical protein
MILQTAHFGAMDLRVSGSRVVEIGLRLAQSFSSVRNPG